MIEIGYWKISAVKYPQINFSIYFHLFLFISFFQYVFSRFLNPNHSPHLLVFQSPLLVSFSILLSMLLSA